MRMLVTVKAYPGIGKTEGETVCVAGVRLDTSEPTWLRLWPVGFRELPPKVQFEKWRIIEFEAHASTKDRRPESFRPNLESLQVKEFISSANNWALRKEILGSLLGQTTLCELMRKQGLSDAPSLGLVKVRPGAEAEIVDGPLWDPGKTLLAEMKAAPHLFRQNSLAPLQPAEFQVRYYWHCVDTECPGHSHSSCDWEVGAAAMNFKKRYDDVRPHLLNNFGTKMLDLDKDTYFFVGNQHQYPKSFLVLGVFYPKLPNP